MNIFVGSKLFKYWQFHMVQKSPIPEFMAGECKVNHSSRVERNFILEKIFCLIFMPKRKCYSEVRKGTDSGLNTRAPDVSCF